MFILCSLKPLLVYLPVSLLSPLLTQQRLPKRIEIIGLGEKDNLSTISAARTTGGHLSPRPQSRAQKRLSLRYTQKPFLYLILIFRTPGYQPLSQLGVGSASAPSGWTSLRLWPVESGLSYSPGSLQHLCDPVHGHDLCRVPELWGWLALR